MHGNFNPRSPHGERLKYQRDVNIVIKFQSTLPARGATKARAQRWNRLVISIHAPRTGSDQSPRATVESARHFNPRSPHGERPKPARNGGIGSSFQSTLPARGATRPVRLLLLRLAISIHAPRTGSDILLFSSKAAFFYFNPRSPHGERRIHTSAHLQANSKFQSTLPARGATTKHMAHRRKFPYFNPRSPHGERPIVRVGDAISNAISIHAPRTGSDAIDAVYCHVGNISIHAPRTGSDGL